MGYLNKFINFISKTSFYFRILANVFVKKTQKGKIVKSVNHCIITNPGLLAKLVKVDKLLLTILS